MAVQPFAPHGKGGGNLKPNRRECELQDAVSVNRGLSPETDDRLDVARPTASDVRPSILILDADVDFRAETGRFLARHGFVVLEAEDFEAGRELIAQYEVDVVILDVSNCEEDGLAITRALSLHSTPSVIIVSDLGSEVDRIVGLEAGADDYLAKPASARELVARIRAVRRRCAKATQIERAGGTCYLFSGWTFDADRRQVRDKHGVAVHLSDGEFSVLRAFVEHPQRVLTRDQLLEYARGDATEVYDRAIDTQISRLRRKLGESEGREMIRTVRNEGYMFMPRVLVR